MNPMEYLMNELNLSEEKAKEVADKMKQLAHSHHPHREENKEEKIDILSLIVEGEAELEAFRKAAQVLHCSGCEKHCSLLTPNCGKGRKTAQLLMQ